MVFYAYIHNIQDDNTSRFVLVFSSRSVADEWWRAIEGSPDARFFQRINAQYYTHDANNCSVWGFFTDSRFNDINGKFRGKLFMTLIDDRGGRQIPVIPVLNIVDHVSGNWFLIRSKSCPSHYWDVDPSGGLIASNTRKTQFQISGRNLKEGTIMIGSDLITIRAANCHDLHLDGRSVCPGGGGRVATIMFDDIQKGTIAFRAALGDHPAPLYFNPDMKNEGWELV